MVSNVNTGLGLGHQDCCSRLTGIADHPAISTEGSTVQLLNTKPLPSLMRKHQNPQNYDVPQKDSKRYQGQGNTPDLQNNSKSIGKKPTCALGFGKVLHMTTDIFKKKM